MIAAMADSTALKRIGLIALGASHSSHHASSLGKIAIKAFALQGLTQRNGLLSGEFEPGCANLPGFEISLFDIVHFHGARHHDLGA